MHNHFKSHLCLSHIIHWSHKGIQWNLRYLYLYTDPTKVSSEISGTFTGWTLSLQHQSAECKSLLWQ